MNTLFDDIEIDDGLRLGGWFAVIYLTPDFIDRKYYTAAGLYVSSHPSPQDPNEEIINIQRENLTSGFKRSDIVEIQPMRDHAIEQAKISWINWLTKCIRVGRQHLNEPHTFDSFEEWYLRLHRRPLEIGAWVPIVLMPRVY